MSVPESLNEWSWLTSFFQAGLPGFPSLPPPTAKRPACICQPSAVLREPHGLSNTLEAPSLPRRCSGSYSEDFWGLESGLWNVFVPILES